VYTVRILNNERTLLGVLPVLSWKYNNRFNEASEFSITVARTLEPELSLDSEAYTLIEPHLPAVQEDAPAHFVQPNVYLSYYLQLYKGSELVAMGQVARRDFSTNTVSIKAHTEEFELSKYTCPADYSRCYDGMDICDLARDVTRAWRTSRVKAKSEWDSAVASSGIDTATEPSVVMLAKSGTAYVSSGYITLEFSRPFQWDRWERIRWSGDSEAPVYTTMAYRTYNGSVWTDWTAETEGAYPAELGVEIADTSAQKVQVRITLSTDDTTSEDDSGNPVGVTPRLFAVEVISRTAPMLTVSGDASSGVLLEGIEANEKSALQILQDAFELYGWEFYVLDGTLHIAEAFGSELGRLFRNGTNIDIHQLSDGLDDVYNVLKAKGQGSGINRPMIEISDAESILEYGVIEHVEEYDTSDITELTSLATADLNEHKDAKPTWKLNTMFPYGEEPDFGIGDIVKVADPNTGIVSTTRIEQEIRSYSGGKLDIECYLGVVRLDLTPRREPEYRDVTPIERPLTVKAYGAVESIVVNVTKPLRDWSYTEVFVSDTAGFTPSASNLIASERSTKFEITGLDFSKRYYIRARHVKTNGDRSAFSEEASALPLAAQELRPSRHNFGGRTTLPTADPNGNPLIAGDYFLASDTFVDGGITYEKAKIYEWNGTGWFESANTNLVMTVFDDFADVANDVDETVIGNAVIKKLVAISAFINNLKVKIFEVIDGLFSLKINKTDGILQKYDSQETFHAKPNGDVMLGNYSETTKSGGIYYSKADDKLYGNVAYDQWDFVVESDADLALLTTGTEEWKNVFIAPGVYNLYEPIAFNSHKIRIFKGCGTRTEIRVKFDIQNGSAFYLGWYLSYFGDLDITVDNAQTGNLANFPSVVDISDITLWYPMEIHRVRINCSYSNLVGMTHSGSISSLSKFYCHVSDCLAKGAMGIGFYLVENMVNCRAYQCDIGFRSCHRLSNCRTQSTVSIAFKGCEFIATCTSYSSTGTSFDSCYAVSSCWSNNSWGAGNTKVDSDSCNNV